MKCLSTHRIPTVLTKKKKNEKKNPSKKSSWKRKQHVLQERKFYFRIWFSRSNILYFSNIFWYDLWYESLVKKVNNAGILRLSCMKVCLISYQFLGDDLMGVLWGRYPLKVWTYFIRNIKIRNALSLRKTLVGNWKEFFFVIRNTWRSIKTSENDKNVNWRNTDHDLMGKFIGRFWIFFSGFYLRKIKLRCLRTLPNKARSIFLPKNKPKPINFHLLNQRTLINVLSRTAQNIYSLVQLYFDLHSIRVFKVLIALWSVFFFGVGIG